MKKVILYLVRKRNIFILMLTVAGMLMSMADQAQAAEYYTWPSYSPTLAYDYYDEYGEISQPTQVCPDGVTGVAGTYIDGWWCFRWGSNKNSLVTEDAWIPMLERFNEDFAYITDVMRWPRDSRALNGYYSTIYLYGSGLSTDSAGPWDTGGWQSSAGGYPMVLASYYPVYCFDPACDYSDKEAQQGAMIHEGIHCILASMPGCNNSCWFHEGGNTWLQGTMEAQRAGDFSSIGWLSAGAAIAPFMPIECYSGWLQDGSFGGPCAEGEVNRWEGSQQICTWRNLLGGTQYGECFPHALEIMLGPKSVAWIWRYCSQSGRVLQDMAQVSGGLGDTQMRRLIKEYRARQAFCDFGQWSYAFRQLLNDFWNVAIEEEWSPYWIDVDVWYATCYVDTAQNGSVLTPEDRTLPGWSGANQIPLTVDSGASEASVTFNPIGSNMSCQLTYRKTSGEVVYGPPVSSGTCSIPLDDVMNNVIVAVICNTNYTYTGVSILSTKYDYTITMGTGITGKANINTQWYAYSPSSYTITASATGNGTISPSGNVVVSTGANQSFTMDADSGYEVEDVVINGLSVGVLDSYTFTNVHGDHTISVTFSGGGGDTDPPTPNPATWATQPYATGTDSIAMVATTGYDASGTVEYYFDETSGNSGGSDSGWQSSPSYTDTGLSADTQYTYTVQMRDAYENTGTASSAASATTQSGGGGGTTTYTFSGITQSNTEYNAYACDVDVFPFAGSSSNRNTQVEATDTQYVNISADNTSEWSTADPGRNDEIFLWVEMTINETPSSISQIDLTFNGNTDGWGSTTHRIYVMTAGGTWYQSSAWTQVGSDMSIQPDVDTSMTRSITSNISNYIDSSGKIIWGVYETRSSEDMRINYLEMVVTSSGGGGEDTDPPTPNPATWATEPYATSSSAIAMVATTGSDASGTVEYYFDETSGNSGGSDSGWQSSSSYTDTGLSASTQYTYTVQMRDAYQNIGTASSAASATTEEEGGEETNLALDADVSTSYVSSWETLEAVNDGYEPSSSSDYTHGAYGNWRGSDYYDTWNYVQYDFDQEYQINSTSVYWWDDGYGIEQPYDAYIMYLDGDTWVEAGDIGVSLDQWNTLNMNVTTDGIRVYMISTMATGILEWQVWGE